MNESVFAFADDGSLTVHGSAAEAVRAWEGVDVESGVVAFYDAQGARLAPRFKTPNRRGRFLGFFPWSESGVYDLVPEPDATGDPFALALHEATVLNPNSSFSSLAELKAALAARGVPVEYPKGV